MMDSTAVEPDVEVRDHGSIYLVKPRNRQAIEWVEEHLPLDASNWGGATAVEHRYIDDIIEGMLADGLSIRFGALILTGKVA